ncbi:hypothetical protein LDENG_00067250, partial [Lucifuga dentata]
MSNLFKTSSSLHCHPSLLLLSSIFSFTGCYEAPTLNEDEMRCVPRSETLKKNNHMNSDLS